MIEKHLTARKNLVENSTNPLGITPAHIPEHTSVRQEIQSPVHFTVKKQRYQAGVSFPTDCLTASGLKPNEFSTPRCSYKQPPASRDSSPSTQQFPAAAAALHAAFPVASSWCDLRKLKALVLSQNVLEGALPSCMANLSSLRILDLSDNRFTGDGASSTPLGNLTLLRIRVICDTGQFLYGPSGAADKTLNLSGNILESNIPPCLGNLNTDAFYLDLSFNQLSGGIPEEIAKFGSLQFLRLSNNRLTGKIPPIIFSFKSLNMLYLDGNNFDGGIPTIDSSTVLLSPLWALDLSNNSLSVFWLNTFCFNSQPIRRLHLSNNRLSGTLTRAFVISTSLVTLDLSENHLTGEIPYWIGNFSALSILLLKGNYFTGEIPIELCKVYSLSIIDLSHNELYGPIPSCLSYLTLEPNENKSSASTNDISGFSVVLEGADYFGLTEFEMVDLEGYRPAIDFPETKDLRVERVVYSTKRGSYTYKGNILEYMSGIDLSCNRLTSEIPLQFGNLSEIRSLNLSHNNLTGYIPSTFSKLKQIESLDISHNNLIGESLFN
ncbi:receptor-like protein kinase 7 [Hibiscus syriacus]|uniref:receptor-like protein kinase 7 n=1 Tax=Hibiscus syriacus TaxID=106335 RepID=UPI0019223B2F|nr:receptor-like protein kinase 7 [Hibiscus syriacus]